MAANTRNKNMSGIELRPRCKSCGNEMCMTRFQSSVTDTGIDREYAYECLWCGGTDKVSLRTVNPQKAELAAAQ
jgi:hypothetical protein